MSFDPEDLQGLEEYQQSRMRKEYEPSPREKIRSITVICLILNRGIGSGIFVTPSKIIQGTQSVGVSLIFWGLGGILVTLGVLVWLTFGLSTPKQNIGGQIRGVPRSGGEKNYFEHVLKRPKFLATCMYGIVFIILGNLAGNAIAMGRYILFAAGKDDPEKGQVLGLAIGALTIAVLLHIFSRRGGIVLSNIFAVYKVGVLLIIIILGFAVRGGANFRKEHNAPKLLGSDFHTDSAFSGLPTTLSSYSSTFFYVLYSYSGFEQPFYVLSEVHRPQRYFAKAVLSAMAIMTVLFVLVNVAYLCVVPKEVILGENNVNTDIATIFFAMVFGNETAKRVMQGAIALSIFGNIIVMTFTASRVKQEIAKEGILPKSLFFATGRITPGAWLMARFGKRGQAGKTYNAVQTSGYGSEENGDHLVQEPMETSPMAALGLHLFASVFLIAVTAKLDTYDSYNFLVSLYSYVIVGLMGCLTSLGLAWCMIVRKEKFPEFSPWGGPLVPLIFFLSTLFLLITAFLKPEKSLTDVIPWWVVPTVGMSTLLWGVVWYGGLQMIMRYRGQVLDVHRRPAIVQDEEDGEWVTKFEIIDQVWRTKEPKERYGPNS